MKSGRTLNPKSLVLFIQYLLAVSRAKHRPTPAPVTLSTINIAGGIESKASTNTGPSLINHNYRWRCREQSIYQHRPQPLVIICWRYREQSICQHRPQHFHNHIYHIKSLSMRIDPDKAYQVARSTKFHFKSK